MQRVASLLECVLKQIMHTSRHHRLFQNEKQAQPVNKKPISCNVDEMDWTVKRNFAKEALE